jgi:hypothetical protein
MRLCPLSAVGGIARVQLPWTAKNSIQGGKNMKFYGKEHENLYFELLEKMSSSDRCHKALAYLITLDSECRKHIDDLYDFGRKAIRPDSLNKGWQTGTSIKTTRLAYNLFTGSTLWCEKGTERFCSASEIFCCGYAPYYFEAVKLRFPEYT